MRRKGFKNYTTQIPAEKTIMEIEYILARFGATDILKEYDASRPIGMSFIVETAHGKIPFKLPMNVMAVRQILMNEKKARRLRSISYKQAEDLDHATNVGWRILKDWIDSQIALIEIDMVKVEQIFLPYIYDPKDKQTLFEAFEKRGFEGMLLE